MEKAKKTIKTLFICRICLWVVALVATLFWAVYSFALYNKYQIFDPLEYATKLRPVLYTGIIVTVVALGVSFFLRKVTLEIKRQNNIR